MKHKTKILFLITLITLLLTLTSINATDNTTVENTQNHVIENHNEITKNTTTPQLSDKKDEIKQKSNKKEIKTNT